MKVNPEKVVTVDFETYYDSEVTLRKLNTSSYIRHPEFMVHMAGIKIGSGPVNVYSGDTLKRKLKAINWNTHALLCHNTAFDGFILSHHYGVKPHLYLDTMSMARGLHSTEIGAGLDEVAKFYGVGNKLPNILNSSAGFKDLKSAPSMWSGAPGSNSLYDDMALYCAEDVRLTYEIFLKMLPEFPESELELIDLIILMFCDPVLRVDFKRAKAALNAEIEKRERLLLSAIGSESEVAAKILLHGRAAVLEEGRKVFASNPKFAALLESRGAEVPTKISPTTGQTTFAFAKSDLEFQALLNDESRPDIQELCEVRLAVKSTLNETRAGRLIEAGRNGWFLPIGYNYYGAHTGRLSGANKMNMQNLKRKSELRKCILAPHGHVLVVSDSSQIEARVLAWLAGQNDLLDVFATGGDPYSLFASTVYGREITKANPDERFVGKVAVLGLGYSMGAAKFQTTLATGAMGPAVFLDSAMCQRVVTTYRRKNHRIVWLWSKAEQIINDMIAGRTGQYKCLSWGKDHILLPNGMKLKYQEIHAVADGNFMEYRYKVKGNWAKIYGGLLVENIVQALARIIVTEQMLTLSNRWRIVMMTHDEIVAAARKAEAKRCLNDMLTVMKTPPAWCKDVPLGAEGGYDVCYSK